MAHRSPLAHPSLGKRSALISPTHTPTRWQRRKLVHVVHANDTKSEADNAVICCLGMRNCSHGWRLMLTSPVHGKFLCLVMIAAFVLQPQLAPSPTSLKFVNSVKRQQVVSLNSLGMVGWPIVLELHAVSMVKDQNFSAKLSEALHRTLVLSQSPPLSRTHKEMLSVSMCVKPSVKSFAPWLIHNLQL